MGKPTCPSLPAKAAMPWGSIFEWQYLLITIRHSNAVGQGWVDKPREKVCIVTHGREWVSMRRRERERKRKALERKRHGWLKTVLAFTFTTLTSLQLWDRKSLRVMRKHQESFGCGGGKLEEPLLSLVPVSGLISTTPTQGFNVDPTCSFPPSTRKFKPPAGCLFYMKL